MIEKILISHLNNQTSALDNVFAERPETIPPSYIVIEKTGSTTTDMITTSTVAIQSCCDSMQDKSFLDAAELNEEVKSVMADLIALDDIVMVDLNSDYNYTDNTTKEYRYQAVYQITHY